MIPALVGFVWTLFVFWTAYAMGRHDGRQEERPTFDAWNTCRPPMTQAYKDALRALEPSSNRCPRCRRNYDPARNWRMDCVTGTCQPAIIAAGSSLPEKG